MWHLVGTLSSTNLKQQSTSSWGFSIRVEITKSFEIEWIRLHEKGHVWYFQSQGSLELQLMFQKPCTSRSVFIGKLVDNRWFLPDFFRISPTLIIREKHQVFTGFFHCWWPGGWPKNLAKTAYPIMYSKKNPWCNVGVFTLPKFCRKDSWST